MEVVPLPMMSFVLWICVGMDHQETPEIAAAHKNQYSAQLTFAGMANQEILLIAVVQLSLKKRMLSVKKTSKE